MRQQTTWITKEKVFLRNLQSQIIANADIWRLKHVLLVRRNEAVSLKQGNQGEKVKDDVRAIRGLLGQCKYVDSYLT
jgi:hypothetical protein